MTGLGFDTQLKNTWNRLRPDQIISEEQLWDLCRIFESDGMLEGNTEFVGVKSIGPFRIAYNDPSKYDIINFFASVLVPALINFNSQLPFNEVYNNYLCPAATLLAYISDKAYLVKDPLEWELLLLIKNMNDNNKWPSLEEILSNPVIKSYDKPKVYNALKSLSSITSLLDSKKKLITIDSNGRYYCSV